MWSKTPMSRPLTARKKNSNRLPVQFPAVVDPVLTEPVKLIVGLGNPGESHRGSRHNAGADLVAALARQHALTLKPRSGFFGAVGRLALPGGVVHLLIPDTYMNRSGQAVAAVSKFYRIDTASILVAHDELDFEAGTARFKNGGGHGGHNGLRDIVKALGPDFLRLRIGIGHPGPAADVSHYVLRPPSGADRQQIDQSIERSLAALPPLLEGDWVTATARLHGDH